MLLFANHLLVDMLLAMIGIRSFGTNVVKATESNAVEQDTVVASLHCRETVVATQNRQTCVALNRETVVVTANNWQTAVDVAGCVDTISDFQQ